MKRNIHQLTLDGHHNIPEFRGNEGVLVTVITNDGVRINVYIDLVDMDVTLTTNANNGKIVPLPQ